MASVETSNHVEAPSLVERALWATVGIWLLSSGQLVPGLLGIYSFGRAFD